MCGKVEAIGFVSRDVTMTADNETRSGIVQCIVSHHIRTSNLIDNSRSACEVVRRVSVRSHNFVVGGSERTL